MRDPIPALEHSAYADSCDCLDAVQPTSKIPPRPGFTVAYDHGSQTPTDQPSASVLVNHPEAVNRDERQ